MNMSGLDIDGANCSDGANDDDGSGIGLAAAGGPRGGLNVYSPCGDGA